MCFSAAASFSAGAVMVAIGAATLRSARGPGELPFAAMPLFFAVQQIIEGTIWLTFDHEAAALRHALTLGYLFFSHLFWPIYVPVAVLAMEPGPGRRRALGVLTALGAALSAWLLDRTLAGGVVAHAGAGHIEYDVPAVSAVPSALLYLLATVVSLLLSSHRAVRLFGILTLLAFVLTYAFYAAWLVSVWCYFAALLSGVVLLHFKTRPAVDRARLA